MRLKKPCNKCPYKLGVVHTPVNPCPECKDNGYKTFELFQKQFNGETGTSDKKEKR